MTELLQQEAQKKFSIQDVFLLEAKHSLIKEFNPTEQHTLAVQLKHGVQSESLIQIRVSAEDQKIMIMRRLVETGLRFVLADSEGDLPSDETLENNTVATIEAVFAADYLVKDGKQPEISMLQAFETNVVYHVWPYWREYLQSSLSRMRLPNLTLPMFSIASPQAIEQGKK